MKITLCILICFSMLALTSCGKETVRVEAEVIKISGTLPQMLSSAGAIFGNESAKIGHFSLVITLKQVNGHIRTLDIMEGKSVTKAALLSRICIGTKVSFTATITSKSIEELRLDPTFHAGKVVADDILVPDPCSG